jgi:hypothetical protein
VIDPHVTADVPGPLSSIKLSVKEEERVARELSTRMTFLANQKINHFLVRLAASDYIYRANLI